MKKVVFFHGEKGGVGKSFAALTYLEAILPLTAGKVIAVDGDMSNPDFGRKAKFTTAEPLLLDFHEPAGWSIFANTVERAEDDTVFIVSLPSQVKLWESEIEVLAEAFGEIGVAVTVFWTISIVRDSVDLLADALARFPATADWQWIVIKNTFWTAGKDDQFELFDAMNSRARLPAIALPRLDALLADRISRDPVSFSSAMAATDRYFAHDRSKIRKFLLSAQEQFARVA